MYALTLMGLTSVERGGNVGVCSVVLELAIIRSDWICVVDVVDDVDLPLRLSEFVLLLCLRHHNDHTGRNIAVIHITIG